MKRIFLCAILSGGIVFVGKNEVMAQSQMNRAAYFLEGISVRHELNPAWMSEKGYVSMPGLGNLSVGAQGTAGIGDFLFVKSNGGLMTFMHEEVDRKAFLNGLPKRVKIGLELNESLLSAGFYAWGGFNTLGLSIKSHANVSVPDQLFRFMKNGVDIPEGSHYSVDNLHLMTVNYAEIALGHARQINEKWTVGVKTKLLVGLARATVKIDHLDIEATPYAWKITPSGAQAYVSAKGLSVPTRGETGHYDSSDYELDANGNRTDKLKPGAGQLISYDDLSFESRKMRPTGVGLAFDGGAAFRWNENWTFSAALLDVGFIRWENTVKAGMNHAFEFEGFHEIPIKSEQGGEDPNAIGQQGARVGDDLKQMAKFTKEGEGLKQTTALAATLHWGAEYTLPVYRHLKMGFLSTSRFQGRHSWTEARISANVSPLSWFEASLNYALSNFGSSTGLMLNFHPEGFNFFVAADVPMGKYTPKYWIPINRFSANVNLGINFSFGPKHKP